MISVVIATYGASQWRMVAKRAFDSTVGQDAEVIVEHQLGGTLASARNAGARRATGDRLIFLDADDELAPGFLDAMRRASEQGYGALLTPAVSFVLRGRKRLPPHFSPAKDLRDGNPLIIGTCVKASRFLAVGGFREWPLFEDWDLWGRCGGEIIQVPEALYFAHVSLTSRNRIAGVEERNYWHQKIGHSNWPDYYEPTTAQEDKLKRVRGVRKI